MNTDDRLDILELIARADTAATARDADTYVSLFTADAVLDGPTGEIAGTEALRRAVGPIWASEGATSVHLTLNAVIDPPDGGSNRAVVRSILLIVRGGDPPTIRGLSSIVQHVVNANGSWRIERRSVYPID
jgi:ketosteroid isomerase-like protein